MKNNKKYVSTVFALVLAFAVFLNDGTIMMAWAANADASSEYEQTLTTNPGADPTVDSGANPTANPIVDPGAGSTVDPATDPGTNPTADPTTDPGTVPTADPTTDPGADPTTDPGTIPTADPTTDPGANSTADPTTEPTETPSTEPTAEPTVTPTATPTTESVLNEEEHVHVWVREEGEVYPVCTECGEKYYDDSCTDEEGTGIGLHLFEWYEEEGIYRCAVCGLEKEVLEEWELTLDEYLQISESEIMPLDTATVEFNGEKSYIPVTLDALYTAVEGGNYQGETKDGQITKATFDVKNLADLIALQKLSEEFNFEGCKVQFVGRNYVPGVNGDDKDWNLTSLPDEFVGLGTEKQPFKGILTTYYANNSLKFTTNKPMLNYAAAGATVSDFQIVADITGTGEPTAIIAAHVVSSEKADKVILSDLSLSGTVKNDAGAAGILFGEVTQKEGDKTILLDYESTSGTLSAAVTGKYAGGIAGKTSGAIKFYQKDLVPTGQIASATADSAAGMFVGSMEGGSFYICSDKDSTVNANVAGKGINGGFIGVIKDGEIGHTGGDKMLTVSGSVVGNSEKNEGKTVIVGGIAGKCENTTLKIDNQMTISAFISTGVQGVDSGAGQGIAGGVIGQFLSLSQVGSSDDDYSLIDHVTVTGSVENAKYVGGIIGEVNGHNIRIGSDNDKSVVSINTTIWGNWTETGKSIGGIIGAAKGQYIEVYRAQVGGTLRVSSSVGGIFGAVGAGDESTRSVVKVKDVTVAATVNPNNNGRVQGGIFGTVYPNSMAALDGRIDISGLSESVNYSSDFKGHIAGKQTEALIYFETEEAYNNCQRPTGRTWVDDIGSYGGVYLNNTWGEDDFLISYAQKKVTGTVTNNGNWELDSEADIIRLAIALNTQGKFEDGCFGSTDKGSLLSADYQLAGQTFDLSRSGIYSLNRNDQTGYNEKFTGTMTGSNNTKIQLGDCTTYQSYVALFPHVGSGAEFRDFALEGTQGARGITYAKNGAAGLAVHGEGNVTVENVSINAAITGSADNASYKYGGMFATFTADAGTTLSVKKSKLSGSININQSTTNNENKHYAGGMIADYISNAAGNTIEIDGLELNQKTISNSRFTSGVITRINGSNTNTDKTILKMSGITIKNDSELKITDNMDAGEDKADVAIGGFLGREWFDVKPYETGHYSINNLVVGENGAGNPPVYAANAGFGAMVHTVTGRVQLVDTTVNKINITGNNTSNDGLLINQGYDALIEIAGYSVDKAGVTIAKAENFSEIVGRNISDNDNYTSGGIVNIISSDFKADSMKVYENQELSDDVKSGSARYYYNLFGNTLAGESTFLQGKKLDSTNLKISDADQMMIWHLSQYMNDSIRSRYLAPYFVSGTLPMKNTGTVTVSGTIDLKGKSYYPTPVMGIEINGAGAEIKFCADKISGVRGKKPSEAGEHYLMHSGLLLSAEGDVTVQGGKDSCLTLTGTVSNAGNKSGALFSGEIAGSKKIYWLKLKDLYISDYSDDHAHGLMIGKVNDDSTLDISWIETDYTNPINKKAASALIGTVGEPDRIINNVTVSGSRNIVIDFTNMKVDATTTGIFKNATFIDQYYYTDDTEKNRGRVWYLFTEEAAQGRTGTEYAPFNDDIHGHNTYSSEYITLGNELKYGVEYWNKDGGADIKDDLIKGGNWADYLPYVCMNSQHPESKQIRVNPKNAAITKGCGVYEDPYIISTPKQLLALACYLTDPKDKYLENWEINQIGNDRDFCQETSHTPVTWELNDQGEVVDGFPTQDQLRNAYYLIDSDINLSNLAYTTDRDIAQKFAGLGTSEKPFTGVIIGRMSGGLRPKITLPNKNKNNLVANFGLIQYAKGAVVKNVEISCEKPDSNDERNANLTNVVRISGTAGAVIACVLGGDNIIDNVTVSNQIAAVNGSAVIGGYVGTVQQGSVILRNMSEAGLLNFKCGTYDTTGHTLTEFTTNDLGNYPYVSGVIGKVENGFVVYEGTVDADTLILGHDATAISNIYSHSVLPLSKTYDIVTSQGLSEAKSSPMNIGSATDDFSCEITTAAQLQIVSMAINSDAFSVYYDGGGYDGNAVCRKANYSNVGRDYCTENTPDYENATGKDDTVYWYPYIYNYFTFDGTTAADSDVNSATGFYKTLETYDSSNGERGYRSKLNAVTGDVTAAMSYSLVNDSNKAIDYDLSVYKRAFRGLGATYRVFKNDNATADLTVGTGVYSDFRANFDGNSATVKAEMSNEYDRAIHTTALFNDLVNVDAYNKYTIKNLVIKGRFSNYDANDTNSENYAGNRAAAAVGMMRRPWTLTNVIASDVTVESNGHAAGIVAWINPGEESDSLINAGNVAYELNKCIVKGTSVIKTGGGSCGGILGVMTPANKDTIADDKYTLSLTDCKVLGTDEKNRSTITNEGKGILNTAANPDFNSQDGERKGRGRTGALIGYVGKRTYKLDNAGDISYIDPEKRVTIQLTIKDTKDTATEDKPTVRYTTVNGVDSTGGIIGEYCGIRADESDTANQNVKIEDVIVSDSLITSKDKNESKWYSFGVGGIIGEIGARSNCTINKVKVLNSDIKSDLNNNSYGLHAGGIVGSIFYYSNVILNEVEVRGQLDDAGYPVYEISSSDASGDAGGLVGRCKGAGAYTASTSSIDNDKTTVTIKSGKVSGMKIVSDNRSEVNKGDDVASGTSTGGVGGMIGEVYKATAQINSATGNNYVKNCVIRTGYNSSTGVGAGGVIGEVWFAGAYDIKGVDVTQCKIGSNGSLESTNKFYAGGIIGYYHYGSSSNDIYKNTLGTLQGVNVRNCDMFGVYTGGLFGYAASYTKVGNVWENESDNIVVSDNKLLGSSYVGGAIGNNDNYSEVITYFEKVTIQDNILLALNDGIAYAGGFCGGQTLAANQNPNSNSHFNQISILNNYIMSCNANSTISNYAGGMFGILGNSSSDQYSLYAYETKLEDNHIGYFNFVAANPRKQVSDYLRADVGQLTTITTLLGSLGKTDDTMPMLIDMNDKPVSDLPDNLQEDDLYMYSKCFGNFVGTYNGTLHAYFLKPTVTYNGAYAGVRPVMDAGGEAKAGSDYSLLDNPYAYRENIHVIYYEPDTTTNTAVTAWGTSEEDKNRLFNQINAEGIMEEYIDAKNTGEILDAYRLNFKSTNGDLVKEVYSYVYKDDNKEYLSPLKNKDGNRLPMIVLDAQYGDADELLSPVFAILTGSGGVYNSGKVNDSSVSSEYDAGLYHITNITAKAMEVKSGVVGPVQGDPSLSVSNSSGQGWTIAYTRQFDQVDDDGNGTFTMLEVTYGQNANAASDTYDTLNGTRKCETITLQIPVFSIEMLTIDTYFKFAEGEVYNVDTAQKNDIKDPLLASDSSYTIYTEYIYGDARNNFSTDSKPISIEKTISMSYTDTVTNDEKTDGFWKGTRFTLIDVSDSNKVYYYEVTGNERDNIIRYTDFTTVPGGDVHYVNKKIHGSEGLDVYTENEALVKDDATYKEVAVERFLIIVDTSKVDASEMGGVNTDKGDIRDYHITPEYDPVDNLKNRTILTEHTDLEVTRQKGLSIELLTDKITCDGAIDKEQKLTVTGQFQITADPQYWEKVLNKPDSSIDSANHNKYLDIELFLRNSDGESVLLPDNTNVTVSGEQMEPGSQDFPAESNAGAYVKESAVYLYKDGKISFPLNDLKAWIQEELDKTPNQTTQGRVTMEFKIELDFENANLTEYGYNEKYDVCLNLLRTEEADYPADGEVIGKYSKTVSGPKQSDLACALETLDLMQLGINTYDYQADKKQIIDFEFKMDFSGVWSNNNATNQGIADKYYTVTYRILEKTSKNGKTEYQPYTGSNLSLFLVDANGGELALNPGKSPEADEVNSRYVSYQFSKEEIEKGTNGIKEHITRELKLQVTNAAKMDLTNYMIQASVMVSDQPIDDIDQEVNTALSDFFIFTVAKLKTDLDY